MLTIHPDPEGKREAVRLRIEEEKTPQKKKKKRKSKSKSLKKKKMVKKFKVGGDSILFFLLQECSDKKEVRKWLSQRLSWMFP